MPAPLQIPKTAAEQDILEVFAPHGEVEQISILRARGVHAGAGRVAEQGCCRCRFE